MGGRGEVCEGGGEMCEGGGEVCERGGEMYEGGGEVCEAGGEMCEGGGEMCEGRGEICQGLARGCGWHILNAGRTQNRFSTFPITPSFPFDANVGNNMLLHPGRFFTCVHRQPPRPYIQALH